MKQRLEQFMISENLTKAQFADSINVARAAISHIMSGRNNPSYEFIINIMKAYPLLNIEWLLIGKGPMYRTTELPESPVKVSDTLFYPENQPSITPNPSHIPDTPDNLPAPTKPHEDIKDIRRASKVLVLYSDGTFEEFCK